MALPSLRHDPSNPACGGGVIGVQGTRGGAWRGEDVGVVEERGQGPREEDEGKGRGNAKGKGRGRDE